MKNLIREIILKPHPFIFNLWSALLPGFIVFGIIISFSPFGFDALSLANRFYFSVIFALVSSVCILSVVKIMQVLLPNFMQEETWVLGKEIVLIFAVLTAICIVNFALFVLLDLSEMQIANLFKIVVIQTIVLSVFPLSILLLIEQYVHQRKKLNQAQRLTDELRNKITRTDRKDDSEDIISLMAENGKIELQLYSYEILYLKAEGNYVEVYYLDLDKNHQKKLLRNRLKNCLNILPHPPFFHCHKSYVVNTKKVFKVDGNARNFELSIRGSNSKVPVSRSKSAILHEFLKSE